MHQRGELALHAGKVLANRRIIINREYADCAAAAALDDLGLARKTAIAIDAGVDARANDITVPEQLGCRVIHGDIAQGTAGETAEDEGGFNTRVVGEGGNRGEVDAIEEKVSKFLFRRSVSSFYPY